MSESRHPASDELLALAPDAQNLLFREARTANTFTLDPVSDEQIRAVYELVKYGPTSMNQQPLRIVLVRSADSRSSLVSHMWERNRAKVAHAPLVAVLAADLEFHEELPGWFPFCRTRRKPSRTRRSVPRRRCSTPQFRSATS